MKSQGGGLSNGENQYISTEENNIPEDVISEILLRLPPNFVIRFKCVCKQWYSLISNPNFLKSYSVNQFHRHRHRRLYNNYIHNDDDILIPRVCTVQPTTFLVLPQNHQTDDDETKETEDLDHLQSSSPSMTLHRNLLNQSLMVSSSRYSNPKDFVGTNLIDSCNGLLLYCTIHHCGWDKQCYYFLCNPTTKHFIKLPSIKFEVERPDSVNKFFCPRIAFDPFLSLTYKVFMWIEYDESSSFMDQHEIYVYSSETHSWKYLTSLSACGLHSYPFLTKTILLNGVLYWSYHYTYGSVSLCIDVDKESVWFLSLPPKPIGMNNRLCLYFGECGGHLRLIERYSVDNGTYWMNKCYFPCSFDIMELNNNKQLQQQKGNGSNSIWTVKYRVRMDISSYDRLFRNNSYPEFAKVLHLYETKNKRGDEKEEEMLLSTDNGCLISFNLDRKTFGRKIITDAHVCYDLVGTMLLYTMTLFPLSHIVSD